MEEKNEIKLVPKGFLKNYILAILKEQELHGYGIIKRINKETGFWKPSPGTIYPILNSLLNEKIIKEKIKDNKKIYSLTKKGIKIAPKLETIISKVHTQAAEFLGETLDLNKTKLKKKLNEHHKKKLYTQDFTDIIKALLQINSSKKHKEAKKILANTINKLNKLSE